MAKFNGTNIIPNAEGFRSYDVMVLSLPNCLYIISPVGCDREVL
jgi:hypothetical protein